MVKLTRIYTRTGDDGSTGLGTGERVQKTDPRVEAYGTVDEANAALGVALAACRHAPDAAAALESIQHDLFDLGADLCIPVATAEQPGQKLRILPAQTARLERLIDGFNADLPTLHSFVLPGGSPLAAALHLARTITRRAERDVVRLMAVRADVNPEALRYLNRLSDLLFVLARIANDGGRDDVLWVPGANRPA